MLFTILPWENITNHNDLTVGNQILRLPYIIFIPIINFTVTVLVLLADFDHGDWSQRRPAYYAWNNLVHKCLRQHMCTLCSLQPVIQHVHTSTNIPTTIKSQFGTDYSYHKTTTLWLHGYKKWRAKSSGVFLYLISRK